MKYISYIDHFDCNCNNNDKYNLLSEKVSKNLKYHIENGIYLSENLFRIGSEEYFNIIKEAKSLYNNAELEVNDINREFLETDIGEKAIFENKEVWLDCPMVVEVELDSNGIIKEAEYNGHDVELNSPIRGGKKAYYVYVKNDKGNVIKVEFGSSMKAKLNDPEARKNYNARHGCSKGKHEDKTKAGYWSCRLPRYAKQLGLSYSGSALWW